MFWSSHTIWHHFCLPWQNKVLRCLQAVWTGFNVIKLEHILICCGELAGGRLLGGLFVTKSLTLIGISSWKGYSSPAKHSWQDRCMGYTEKRDFIYFQGGYWLLTVRLWTLQLRWYSMPIRVLLADRWILLSSVGSTAGPASALWSIQVKDRHGEEGCHAFWKHRNYEVFPAIKMASFWNPVEVPGAKKEATSRRLLLGLWKKSFEAGLQVEGCCPSRKVSFRLIFLYSHDSFAPKLACPGHVQDCIPHLLMVWSYCEITLWPTKE